MLAMVSFLRSVWTTRATVAELARRDFVDQHSGTLLGVFWNYVQPLAYSLILAVVFSIGLRRSPSGAIGYLPFLVSGIVCWHFLGASLSSLSGTVKANAYLVHRGGFNLAILPLGRLLSLTVPHVVVIAATVGICWMNGYPPGLHSLQVIYYLGAMLGLLLGLGWLTSAASLFVKDIQNFIAIVIQFGFWVTPIVWNIETLPPSYRWVVRINPASYLVGGYRDSLLDGTLFWERPGETAYYWMLTLATLLLGATVFRRLKPHFGEVL